MKVYILGPVTTATYYGGVAVFDEGLAEGLELAGCEVALLTDQTDAPSVTTEGISILNVNFRNVGKLLKEGKPDYLITELAYAKYLFGHKSNGNRVYYLHGFFNQGYYGALKAKLAVTYQKLLFKTCDMIFANSYFTAMVNKDFFGINADRVFHVGVKQSFIDKVQNLKVDKEEHSVLFAARLVEAKRGMLFLEAIKRMVEQNVPVHVYLAGDGSDYPRIEKYVNDYNLPVTVLGRVSHEDIMNYYLKSEVFVSLDPSEPFGIVFAEAILCGCRIVCPYTGGQIEILDKAGTAKALVDAESASSVVDGITKMLEESSKVQLSKEQIDYFSYVRLAGEMIEFWNRD